MTPVHRQCAKRGIAVLNTDNINIFLYKVSVYIRIVCVKILSLSTAMSISEVDGKYDQNEEHENRYV